MDIDMYKYLNTNKQFPEIKDKEITDQIALNRYGPYRSTPAQIAASIGVYVPDEYLHDRELEELDTGKTAYLLAHEYKQTDVLRPELRDISKQNLTAKLCHILLDELEKNGVEYVLPDDVSDAELIYKQLQKAVKTHRYRTRYAK